MQQWEYRIVSLYEDGKHGHCCYKFHDSHGVLKNFTGLKQDSEEVMLEIYMQYLNQLGLKSWEVVSARGIHLCILKRPLK